MSDAVSHPSTTGVECILVPVDATKGMDRVVPTGLSLGSTLGVPVRPVAWTRDGSTAAEIVDDLRDRFAGLCDPAIAGGPDLVKSLLAEAEDRSGLVVAASDSASRITRSGRRYGRPFLRMTRRPVVMVGPETRRARPFERILVPVDGTERADDVVPVALAWASACGLAVDLVAFPRPEPSLIERRPDLTARHRFGLDPHGHLTRLLDACRDDGLEVTTQVVRAPIGLAAEIGPLLRDAKPTLLVTSSVAERSRRSLGDRHSPAAILRASPVPVLMVPPPRTPEP